MGFFQRFKKRFRCFGSGWSGEACAATERVWMLTKKAENFKEYSLSRIASALTVWELSSPGWALLAFHSETFHSSTLLLGLILGSCKCEEISFSFLSWTEVSKRSRRNFDNFLMTQDDAVDTFSGESWASCHDTVKNVSWTSRTFKLLLLNGCHNATTGFSQFTWLKRSKHTKKN